MSEFKHVSGSFYAAAQIQDSDIEQAVSDGFSTIINNRPDGEEPGQPASDELKTRVEAAGMRYYHIPVYPGHLGPEQVASFRSALEESEGKVLGFCRSGMRSTCTWALTQAGARSAEDIISSAASAGYDISGMRPRLETAG